MGPSASPQTLKAEEQEKNQSLSKNFAKFCDSNQCICEAPVAD